MTTATDAPQRERTTFRAALGSLVPPGLLLAFIYSLGGTWSIGQGFGGQSDTGWVDVQGRPIDHPPLVAQVDGHPAGWVFAALALLLVATAVWTSRADGTRARRRALIGCAAAVVFVAAVILVFTVLQMELVQQAFERGSPRPPMLGNATLTVAPMVEAG